ncbi:MAG: oxidoreductase [Chloroflexi bacterium]|nr:MAG: oxidoreductase [Chloroflexota bacterium]
MSTAVLGPGRLAWQVAEVTDTVTETPRVRTLVLDVPDWPGHRAGQHVDVRLTAEDGYQAERSYSLAASPEEPPAVTVERLDDGEVSPYLVDEVVTGDRFELRGPIGGYFVWDAAGAAAPLFLVAGGSGVVPLMSMLRHRAAAGSTVPARMLYSSRTLEDVIYRDELEQLNSRTEGVQVVHTLTRVQPPGWTGRAGRVNRELLQEVAFPPEANPIVYVCGPTSFVEAVAEALVGLGHPPGRIRTERFGGA